MNIAQIRKYDVANGPGIRTTVFVSGCTHKCKDCFNEEYQDFNFGIKMDELSKKNIIECLNITKRLSVLGGEPCQQGWDMIEFLKEMKHETNCNIWLWSGYTFEELLNPKVGKSYQRSILENIDVLVDGKFISSKKDLSLKFKGSSNQRIIDVRKSLNAGKVILMEV